MLVSEKILMSRMNVKPPVLIPDDTFYNIRSLTGAPTLSHFITGIGIELCLFTPNIETMSAQTKPVGYLAHILHAIIRERDNTKLSKARQTILPQLCRRLWLNLPWSSIWQHSRNETFNSLRQAYEFFSFCTSNVQNQPDVLWPGLDAYSKWRCHGASHETALVHIFPLKMTTKLLLGDFHHLLARTHSACNGTLLWTLLLPHLQSLISNLTEVLAYLRKRWLTSCLEDRASMFLTPKIYGLHGTFQMAHDYIELIESGKHLAWTPLVATVQSLTYAVGLMIDTLDIDVFPTSPEINLQSQMDIPASHSLDEVHISFVRVSTMEYISRPYPN